MDDLVSVVNGAVRASGRSARQISLDAVASPEFVRDIRRGRLHQVQKSGPCASTSGSSSMSARRATCSY